MGRHRRKKRVPGPVRNGLLGIAAAAAVGAVAVAAGLLPGGGVLTAGDGETTAQQVREVAAGGKEAQGSPSPSPTGRSSAQPAPSPSKGLSSTSGKDSPSTAVPGTKPPATRTPAAKAPAEKPTAPAEKPAAAEAPAKKAPGSKAAAPEKAVTPGSGTAQGSGSTPEHRAAPAPAEPRPKAPSGETAAEAEVLALVNKERAKVGCAPVHPDASLARLAGRFSSDMAARNFFDHTDPEGDSPWDRAAQAGVSGLGAENIARGQADARTVMNAWMNSDGHRANILNCDYRTLGVGVSFAQGGPWWTQDFGF
ncbi:SCP-like extracellular [Streptomyces spongiicola]|uniref:SCP-like extracellular n=1 Tax=Streptomyces spongiicola TaxID=1690221 RepID=A0A388T2S4_9ACTN|nr:CAP domain-containing protein [Streptomyces spongiicola]GBQ01505.1 SCP-like extracellular [Streptomyces spongiicola]